MVGRLDSASALGSPTSVIDVVREFTVTREQHRFRHGTSAEGIQRGARWSVRREAAGCLAAVALLHAVPSVALAQGGLRVMGRATARNAAVVVACTSRRGGEGAVECSVRANMEIRANEAGVRLCVAPCQGATLPYPHVAVDGEVLRGPRELAEGERVAVEVRLEVSLSVERGWDAVVSQAPIGLRHPLLGQSWLLYRSADRVEVQPISGTQLELEGSARVQRPRSSRVRVDVEEETGVSVQVELHPPFTGPPPGALAHGGPVVTLGGRLGLDDRSAVGLFGIAYELGLLDYLVVSAAVETDFVDHMSEALVIEVATPGVFFLVPSLSAGVGVVARQLGVQGADAGPRLRVGATFYAAGFVADFDYWAVTGTWTATLSARVGL